MTPLVALDTWLELALKGVVVLSAAAVAARLLRRAPASTRHLVWATALCGLVVLPFATSLVPRVPLTVPAWLASATPDVATTTAAAPAADRVQRPVPFAPAVRATTTRSQSPHTSRGDRPTSAMLLVWTWLLGTVVLLARMFAGVVASKRLVSSARPLTDRRWLDWLDVAAGEMGCARPVRLLISSRLTVPVTCGIVSPAIVVPDDAVAWDEARVRVVLLHELAHIRRHDCLVHFVAQAAVALHWMNPLAWGAVTRMRSERERACDDLVLGTGTSGPMYAEHLLDIARGATRGPALTGMALAMARPSELEGRLLAVLDRTLSRGTAGRSAVLAALLVAGSAVSVVAAVTLQVVPDGPIQQSASSPPAPTPTPTPSPTPAPRAKVAVHVDQAPDVGVPGGVKGGVAGGVDTVHGRGSGTGQGTGSGNHAAVPPAVRDNVVQALVGALKDEDPEVRQQAMHALMQLRAPALFEPMVAALGDSNAEVRQQAALALAQLDDKRAAGPLTRALGDADADVRQQAAFGL